MGTQEEIDKAAIGKVMVEDKSFEKDRALQDEHQRGGEIQVEEKRHEGEGLNSAVENKEEASIDRDEDEEERAPKRKRERKALREVSPVCDYERIRAANIAERMALLQTLDMEGAVAGAKEGSI